MTQEIKAIIREMQLIRSQKKDLDEEEDVLWRRVFEIADDANGEGESYRFVDPEQGLAIGREMHLAAPRLDVESFKKNLTPEEWKLVSQVERVISFEKLETAVASGKIFRDIVERHTERPAAVPHKKFGLATKKDLEGGPHDKDS